MLPFGIHLFTAVLFLIIIPIIMGNTLLHILNINSTLSSSYIFGSVMIMALMQIISVPLILLKFSFIWVFFFLLLFSFVWLLIGFKKKYSFPQIFPPANRSDLILFDLMVFLCILFLIVITLSQHTDDDDFLFVVNAVDIVDSNKLFLIDPNTGDLLSTWLNPRYIVSPWAVYIAYYAKLTGIHATCMAHLVLPVPLTCLCLAAYWNVSASLFTNSVKKRSVFIIFILILLICGHNSIYTAETFTIFRIWQGKATVAGFGVPLLVSLFLSVYHNKKCSYSHIFLLLLTEFALCLMSGMGILIGAIMTAVYGLIYGLSKRNISITFFMWVTVIPNLIYTFINLRLL